MLRAKLSKLWQGAIISKKYPTDDEKLRPEWYAIKELNLKKHDFSAALKLSQGEEKDQSSDQNSKAEIEKDIGSETKRTLKQED